MVRSILPSRCLLGALLLVSAASLGCAADCDALRDDARALVKELDPCTPGDTCVAVSVLNDCLGGALTCGFAVPQAREAEARTRAEELATESLGCTSCAQASCAAHGPPACDAATRRCVLTAP